MKASELVKILQQLIKDNGDNIIRIVDHESGWCCNTVTNVKVLQKININHILVFCLRMIMSNKY